MNLDATPGPHNETLERAVLGAAFLRGDLALRLLDAGIRRETFHVAVHRDVWSAVEAVARAGSVDEVAVVAELERAGRWTAIGGAAYFDQLLDTLPSGELDLDRHAEDLLRLARLRDVDAGLASLRHRIREGASPEAVAAELAALAAAVTGPGSADDAADLVERLGEGHPARGVRLPLRGFDGAVDLGEAIGPLDGGQAVVVGAGTSVGKTAFMVTLFAALLHDGTPAAYLALENSAEEIAARLAGQHLGFAARSLLSGGERSQAERDELACVAGLLRRPGCGIERIYDASPAGVASAVRRWAGRGARAVFVDYLQRVRTPGRNRVSELGDAVGLISTAAGHEAALVVGSQINREGAKAGERPRLWHLRDSGAIENEARAVLLLSDADPTTRPEDRAEEAPMTIDLAKATAGPTGSVPATFWRRLGVFWPGSKRPTWTWGVGAVQRDSVAEGTGDAF